jgi:CheY-like chemotaxis protein
LSATFKAIKLLAATHGRHGVELARRHRPDLILLDVHLPAINGNETRRLLRSEDGTREIPVTVVSADVTPHQIEHLRAAGANDYLAKPLDIKSFMKTLDAILGRKWPPIAPRCSSPVCSKSDEEKFPNPLRWAPNSRIDFSA